MHVVLLCFSHLASSIRWVNPNCLEMNPNRLSFYPKLTPTIEVWHNFALGDSPWRVLQKEEWHLQDGQWTLDRVPPLCNCQKQIWSNKSIFSEWFNSGWISKEYFGPKLVLPKAYPTKISSKLCKFVFGEYWGLKFFFVTLSARQKGDTWVRFLSVSFWIVFLDFFG